MQKKFKVGDKVMISKDSPYYGTSVYNPSDVVGIVTYVGGERGYKTVRVKWPKGKDNCYDYSDLISTKEVLIKSVIQTLAAMEVDGETMQYILEEVGMDEQMAVQLSIMYPKVVEKRLKELKELNKIVA